MKRVERPFGVAKALIADFAAAWFVTGILVGVVAILPPHRICDDACSPGEPLHWPVQEAGGIVHDCRVVDGAELYEGTDCRSTDALDAESPHDELIDAGLLQAVAEDMSGRDLC